MAMPKVVILGAGFGGLTAARALSKQAEVVLIDRHNFQTFLPLLYQVSTAGLAADHVAYPPVVHYANQCAVSYGNSRKVKCCS